MNTLKVETFQYINLEYEYAGVLYRILARLIDWGVCFAYMMVVLLVFYGTGSGGAGVGELQTALLILFMLPVLLYTLLSEIFLDGQTLGKKAMKLKVMSLRATPVTVGQYLLRWMFLLVDYISYVGLIMIAVTNKKQRVGDVVAGTTVVSLIPRAQAPRPRPLKFAPDYRPVFLQVTKLGDADVQVLREVVRTAKTNRDPFLPIVDQASSRMREVLGLYGPEYNGLEFLEALIMDYTYLTEREVAG